MRHRDKYKTVFLHFLQLEKIKTNRTYMQKSQYAKHSLEYCDLVYYK